LQVLLGLGFDGDKAHAGPRDGFADGFRVVGIVFVGFDVGLDELRCDQLDGMALLLQLTRPMVRTTAGFHAVHGSS
jgi:hypothetical protein